MNIIFKNSVHVVMPKFSFIYILLFILMYPKYHENNITQPEFEYCCIPSNISSAVYMT